MARRATFLMHYRSYLSLLARVQLGARLMIKADASDIVQEIFWEDKRDLAQFCATRLRGVRLERSLADNLEESSSQQASKREQAVLLAEALGRLPEHYRPIILFRNVEGHSFSDAAATIDRIVDRVQKLWVRALAQIRRLMGNVS